MTGDVYQQFFAQRKVLASILGTPENLTGMYYVINGPSICYCIREMLKPHPKWEEKQPVQLGYNPNNSPAAVKEYFDLSKVVVGTGHFYLERLAGCCGAAHLSSMHTTKEGMGKVMLAMAETAAYNNGYRLITGTVIESYGQFARARHLIKKFGWDEHRTWRNHRTGNTVYLVSKELTAENAGRRKDDGTGKSSNSKSVAVARPAGFSA